MKYLFLLSLLVLSCSQSDKKPDAQEIIDRSIIAHGLDALDHKTITFTFRDREYSLFRSESSYTYTRAFEDSLGSVKDILINSTTFTRLIDGDTIRLDEEWSSRYANSVNSVLYFIQLPYLLNDPAAIKKHTGEVTIEGETYDQVEVRFQQEDGGKDFEDVFLYWFHKETARMNYLAYSYITDGGGVRFRKAINQHKVEGILFQDYINYKPEDKHTPLEKLPGLFESDQLKELSRIENREINISP